jgi:hypothetical protein
LLQRAFVLFDRLFLRITITTKTFYSIFRLNFCCWFLHIPSCCSVSTNFVSENLNFSIKILLEELKLSKSGVFWSILSLLEALVLLKISDSTNYIMAILLWYSSLIVLFLVCPSFIRFIILFINLLMSKFFWEEENKDSSFRFSLLVVYFIYFFKPPNLAFLAVASKHRLQFQLDFENLHKKSTFSLLNSSWFGFEDGRVDFIICWNIYRFVVGIKLSVSSCAYVCFNGNVPSFNLWM